MNNKFITFVLGMFIFFFLIVGSIALGRSGLVFVHIPSVVFVIVGAGALGLTTYKGGGLIAFIGCCKRYCIPAGVLGAMIGVIQMLVCLKDVEALRPGIAICLLTVFYGVICYCLADAIVTKAAD